MDVIICKSQGEILCGGLTDDWKNSVEGNHLSFCVEKSQSQNLVIY